MPIIWRYLYKQFFKVFLLTTISFIFILLVTRLKEIARFVSLSPEPKYVFMFIINIIPYILPIAIPIASLVSAIILFHKLSRTHELTALRSSRYSLFSLIFPILCLSLFLSLLNFFIVSELTSYSQIFSRRTINELITTNPFYMLENKNKLKKKDLFVDMLVEERGKSAKNLVIITPDKENTQLNLMAIEKMSVENDQLHAPSINVISIMEVQDNSFHDHVIIENEHEIVASASDLTKIMHQTHLHLQPQHLSMPLLLITLKEKQNNYQLARVNHDLAEVKKTRFNISDLKSEVVRRISIGLAVFTFTFIGISYSIEIGRNRKKRPLIILSALTIFGLLCFFVGKMFHGTFWLAALVYLVPHFISFMAGTRNLSRTMRGIE